MNGTSAGTWNVQSGFGMVNAVAAINAVDLLRVASTSPANGATVTVAPAPSSHLQQGGQFLDPYGRGPDLLVLADGRYGQRRHPDRRG